MKVLSEANNRDHWTKKNKRKLALQNLVFLALRGKKYPLPCTVTFDRHGKRLLDDENLSYAFKGIKDKVAQMVVTQHCGLAIDLTRPIGWYDSDQRISWHYKQSKGPDGFSITIQERIDKLKD